MANVNLEALEEVEVREDMLKEKINDDAKLKIGVVGVGNAGGQSAITAFQLNFDSYVINSSIHDLSSDIMPPEIPNFLIGNSRGCGMERSIAQSFLLNNNKDELKKLFTESVFSDLMINSDVIVFIGSTGGGTGSGALPIIVENAKKVFKDDAGNPKNMIAIGVLCKKHESAQAQWNSFEFGEEIDKLEIPWTLLDLESTNEDNTYEAYKKIQKQFGEIISVIRGDYFGVSSLGNIDQTDTLSIFTNKGYFTVTVADDITEGFDEFEDILIDAFDKGYHAPIEKDKIVKTIGVVINTPKTLIRESHTNGTPKLEDRFGIPLKSFIHNGVVESPKGSLVLILSGLTMPYTRLQYCKNKVDEVLNSRKTSAVSLSEDKAKMSSKVNAGKNTTAMLSGKGGVVDMSAL